MFDQNSHLNDEKLIRLVDGEMSETDMQKARAHCSECSLCQSRRLHIEQASSEFADLHFATNDLQVLEPSLTRSTKLKERLTPAGQKSSAIWPRQFARFAHGRSYLLIATAVVILAVIGFSRIGTSFRSQSLSLRSEIRLLPDNALTPGATRPVSLAESCSQQKEDLDPAVSVQMRKFIFREYGIKTSNDTDYQVDYLINPQLGGTNDVRNLWPEPYHSTVWNAHAKDALEDQLHQMVCNRQIDLASAQRELATNWIAAYKKHFHTETPS